MKGVWRGERVMRIVWGCGEVWGGMGGLLRWLGGRGGGGCLGPAWLLLGGVELSFSTLTQ